MGITDAEKAKNLKFLKRDPGAYGGDLYKTRRGRARPRPLSQKHSMHLVLRSTQAKGKQSFIQHEKKVVALLKKFSAKHHVELHSYAVQSNHLHLHVHTHGPRASYQRFIRAFTSSVAMLVTKTSRWNQAKTKFWDARPFTRLVRTAAAFTRVKRYIRTNFWESHGCTRSTARFYSEWEEGLHPGPTGL